MKITPSNFLKHINVQNLISTNVFPSILDKIETHKLDNYRNRKEIKILHNETKKIEQFICKYINSTCKQKSTVAKEIQKYIIGCNPKAFLDFLNKKSTSKINKALTNIKIENSEIDIIYKTFLIDVKSYKKITNNVLISGIIQIIIYYYLIEKSHNIQHLILYNPLSNTLYLLDIKKYDMKNIFLHYQNLKKEHVKPEYKMNDLIEMIKSQNERIIKLEKIIYAMKDVFKKLI
jgi:hypothetical protein